jgi:hypothetical protein
MANLDNGGAGYAATVKKWFPSPVWVVVFSLAIGAFTFHDMYDSLMENDEDICEEAGLQSVDCETFKTTYFGNAALSQAASITFWALVIFSAIYGAIFWISVLTAALVSQPQGKQPPLMKQNVTNTSQILNEGEKKPPF